MRDQFCQQIGRRIIDGHTIGTHDTFQIVQRCTRHKIIRKGIWGLDFSDRHAPDRNLMPIVAQRFGDRGNMQELLRCCNILHSRSAPLPHIEIPLVLQQPNGLADGGAAHLELRLQLLLGGKKRSDFQMPLCDLLLQYSIHCKIQRLFTHRTSLFSAGLLQKDI